MSDDLERPTTDVDQLRAHLFSHADVAEAVSRYGVSLDELAFFHGRKFEVPYIWSSGVFGKASDADTERLIGDFSTRDIAENLRRFAADVRRSDEEEEWLSGDLQDAAELVMELRRYRVQRAVAEGCYTRDVTSEGFEQAWTTRTGVDFYADAPPLTQFFEDDGVYIAVDEWADEVWEGHYNETPDEISSDDERLDSAVEVMRAHSSAGPAMVAAIAYFPEFAFKRTGDEVFKKHPYTYLVHHAAFSDLERFTSLLEAFAQDEDYI